jgi:hypothetical protein
MVDKNSIFGGMLTIQGAAKKTNCDALGIPWEPRYMLIGDANGTDPVPNPSQIKLINQVYRAQINQLYVSPTDANVLIAELVLPPDVGGWWVRELALEDKDGVFSAVANAAPSYKPQLQQNSGRNQVVRMHIITSGTANIQLKIDPAVVLATRQYVDSSINGLLPANKPAGSYTKVTVNDRGVFVSGSNPTTLAGMGITDTFTKTEVESIVAQASALPVGTMVAFPVNKVAPGFLEIDGSVKSIAAYPDLAAFLGTAFNLGNEGVGNFRLPESRGEFLRGWDHGRGVNPGRGIGSWEDDAFEGHTHKDTSFVDNVGGGSGAAATTGATPVATTTWGKAYGSTGATAKGYVETSPGSIGGAASGLTSGWTGGAETRPRNLSVMWCIKAWNAPINQGNIDIAALEQKVHDNEFGRLLGIRKFTANGLYVPTPGMKKVRLRQCGGGAGSGGVATTSSTQTSASGGGAAGGYAEALLTAEDIGASQVVTIGAAGVAGVAAGVGGPGGTTSLGALVSAPGGSPSGAGPAVAATAFNLFAGGAPGALPTGGNLLNSAGAPGTAAMLVNASTIAGNGGSGPLGMGGNAAGAVSAPNPGSGYGSGGGGVANGVSSAAKPGAPGAPGVMFLEEYA